MFFNTFGKSINQCELIITTQTYYLLLHLQINFADNYCKTSTEFSDVTVRNFYLLSFHCTEMSFCEVTPRPSEHPLISFMPMTLYAIWTCKSLSQQFV